LQVQTITLPIDSSMPDSKLLGQIENYAKGAQEIKRDSDGRITRIGILKNPSNQMKNYGSVNASVSVNLQYCDNTIVTVSDVSIGPSHNDEVIKVVIFKCL